MSVTELVKAREELVEKMTQIDEILNQAVAAVGAVRQQQVPRPMAPMYNSNDPFREQGGQALSAQVAMSREQPRVAPVANNAPDQSTAFSIFDAESYNADVEAGRIDPNGPQYLVDTPGQPVNPTNYVPPGVEPMKPLLPTDSTEVEDNMAEEMNTLMSEVTEGLKNVKSTETTGDDG